MIQSLEYSLGLIPRRKPTPPIHLVFMLLTSISAILLLAISSNASASANLSQAKNIASPHYLLLFETSSLKKPLR